MGTKHLLVLFSECLGVLILSKLRRSFSTGLVLILVALGRFSSAQDERIIVKEIWNAALGSSAGYAVDISPNSLCAAILKHSDSCELKTLRIETGEVKWSKLIRENEPCTPEIIFTPDGTNLLFFDAARPELLVFDVETGEVKSSFKLTAPLFHPRFDLSSPGEFVFAFKDLRTFEVVKIDLASGDFKSIFNLRNHPEFKLKRPYVMSRDFLVHNNEVFVAVEGWVMAYDVDQNRFRWKLQLSETQLLLLSGPKDGAIIATRGPFPNILKIDSDGVVVGRGVSAGEENYLGSFEEIAFTRSRGVIGFPEFLSAYDWKNSKLIYREPAGKSHSTPPACVMSKDGKFILSIDVLGNAACRKVSR